MFLKYSATCCTMSVEPSSYASVTQRQCSRQNCTQFTSLHCSVNKMAVSACRCHVSLTTFSVSLLCNPVLSVLSLPKQIRTFHTSQKVSWFFDLEWFFFSITSQSFVTAVLCDSSRSSCPLLLSLFELGFSDTACDSCCENLLHMQNNQNLGSSLELLAPFIFCSFKHWHSNTVVASLSKHLSLRSSFVLLYYGRYSEGSKSLHLKLWKNATKF